MMGEQENIEQKESTGEEQPQAQEQKPDQEQKSDQEQPQAQEQKPDQEQPQAQEQKPDQEQPQAQEQKGDKEINRSEENPPTIVQVLDFLKKSNLVNLDLPMKSLVEQVQSVQPDLPVEWGFIGDTGHWVLVWKKEE
jgi:ATP-dependent 26S proteasome regulatory subunit